MVRKTMRRNNKYQLVCCLLFVIQFLLFEELSRINGIHRFNVFDGNVNAAPSATRAGKLSEQMNELPPR